MTDALCASFKRYLRDTPGLSPEEYVERIRALFQVPQRSPSHLRLNPVWSSAAAQA